MADLNIAVDEDTVVLMLTAQEAREMVWYMQAAMDAVENGATDVLVDDVTDAKAWRDQLRAAAYRATEPDEDAASTVRVCPREFAVCALPPDDFERHNWEIAVSWRSPGRWAVTRFKQCLSADGEWDYESIPGERADDWKATHRFPLGEALRRARERAPDVMVNGLTPAGVLEWRRARRDEES